MNTSASYSEASGPIVELVARARAAQRIYETWSQAQVDTAVTAAGWALIEPAPGPALIAEMRSDVMAVERALQRLPRRHRAVLMALRFDEMSRQEVADRYRLSLRNVDTALRQALDRCRA